MNVNEFTQFFPNPAVSIFNRSKTVEFPLRIGKFYPSKWDLLGFGNSQKSSSGHKMRLAPLLAPNFADMRVQEHAAVIPLRVLMEDYEKKFNYALNRDGAILPHFKFSQYRDILLAMCSSGINPVGSLLDFLGYPVFADLFKVMVSNLGNFNVDTGVDTEGLDNSPGIYDMLPFTFVNDAVNSEESYSFSISGEFRYRNRDVILSDSITGLSALPFFWWLFIPQFRNDVTGSINYNGLYNYLLNVYRDIFGFDSIDNEAIPSLEQLLPYTRFETVSSAIDAYHLYLFFYALGSYLSEFEEFPDSVTYTTLPLRAYWRVVYDFLINGNFVDRETMLEQRVYNFDDMLENTVSSIITDGPDSVTTRELRQLVEPINRLWDFDFFTSLLPTSAADDAIQIPANSTVLDLAKLTSIQRLALKLSYSSRYRDVVWNIFKIKPSDARLQQSSIIYQKSHQVGIGETIQTSETSVSSVLGSFAGRGYSSGGSKGYHIMTEEPAIVMDFVSIVPRAVYADSVHPLIHLDDILDFPIPDMDVLGNQPIRSDLLTGNPYDFNTVLGYGRQYEEWLYSYNTVHGDFKTSLDYWQLLRRFTNTPVINDSFLRMHDADDFDSIFSVPSAPHAFISIFYSAKVSRPVHRNVRIMI